MSRELAYVSMVLPERFDIRQFIAGYDFKPKAKKRVIRDRQTREFKRLKKEGALTYHMAEQRVVVQHAYFTKQRAADWIIQKAGDLLLREGFTPRRVFVGRKQFMELANVALPQAFGSFDFGLDMRFQTSTPQWAREDNDYRSHVCWHSFNIVVEVIPWMDGVLVI